MWCIEPPGVLILEFEDKNSILPERMRKVELLQRTGEKGLPCEVRIYNGRERNVGIPPGSFLGRLLPNAIPV